MSSPGQNWLAVAAVTSLATLVSALITRLTGGPNWLIHPADLLAAAVMISGSFGWFQLHRTETITAERTADRVSSIATLLGVHHPDMYPLPTNPTSNHHERVKLQVVGGTDMKRHPYRAGHMNSA